MAIGFLSPTRLLPSPPLAMAGRARDWMSPSGPLPSPSETIGAAMMLLSPNEGLPHPHIMSRAKIPVSPRIRLPGSAHIVPATLSMSPIVALPGPDYTRRAIPAPSPIGGLRGSHFPGWASSRLSPTPHLPSPFTPQGEPQWT